jgi:hypothetical protein
MSSRTKLTKAEKIYDRLQELDGNDCERGVLRGIAEKRVKAMQRAEFERRVDTEHSQLRKDAEQSIREELASGSGSSSGSESASASASA